MLRRGLQLTKGEPSAWDWSPLRLRLLMGFMHACTLAEGLEEALLLSCTEEVGIVIGAWKVEGPPAPPGDSLLSCAIHIRV